MIGDRRDTVSPLLKTKKQKWLWNIRSRLNFSTFWVFEPVFRYVWSKLRLFEQKINAMQFFHTSSFWYFRILIILWEFFNPLFEDNLFYFQGWFCWQLCLYVLLVFIIHEGFVINSGLHTYCNDIVGKQIWSEIFSGFLLYDY